MTRAISGTGDGLILSVLLLMLAACPRERSASAAEELLPKATQGALVTAPLAGVAQNASALLNRASQLPGGEQLGDWRRAVVAQLGFDPFSREGQLAAGLDPDRGAALVFSPDARTAWVAAVPLTRPEVFSQTVDRLLRERAAYALRQDEPRGKVRVAVYSREGERERVAFALVRGYGVLVRGDDPAAQIGAAASLARESSLAQDAHVASARQQIGAQDVTLVLPSGSALVERFSARPLPGDLAVGLTGTAQGISSKLFFQAAMEQAQRIKASLPGGAGALVRFLPRDAPFVVRLGLQPADALREARRLPELAELLARVGDDVSNDIAAALLPGTAFSIDLRPGANLAALVDFGFLDWHKRSPLETFQVVALARVADRTRLERAFDRTARALESVGAHATRAAAGWQVRYPAGEGPRFGIRDLGGKPVAYLVGGGIAPEQLGATVERTPVLEQDQGASLQIDLGKLAARVRALPDSAYGSGPQAYVARSLISQVVEPLAPLRVSAAAIPRDEGVRAEVDVAVAPGKP